MPKEVEIYSSHFKMNLKMLNTLVKSRLLTIMITTWGATSIFQTRPQNKNGWKGKKGTNI